MSFSEVLWATLIVAAYVAAGVFIYKKNYAAGSYRVTQRDIDSRALGWTTAITEADSLDEQIELGNPPNDFVHSRYKRRVDDLWGQRSRDIYVRAQEEKARARKVEAKVAFITLQKRLDNRDGVDPYQLLTDFYDQSHLLDESDQTTYRQLLADATTVWVGALVTTARHDNADAFNTMNAFVERGRLGHDGSTWYRYVGSSYVYPGDWDDLVIRYVRSPGLADFKLADKELTTGAVLLLAAQAIREEHLLLAQLALAYCKVRQVYQGHTERTQYWPYRDAMGGVLIAELAKLVERLQLQQQLLMRSRDQSPPA